MLLDQHEPNGLVEPTRWVVLGDAQTEGTAPLGDARLDQCALDAIGIPAALGINASAVTCCPTCGTELRVRLVDGQPRDDAALVLWLPAGSCEHLVEDFCNHANLYCDREHLETAVQHAPGQPITVVDAAEIGRHTWGDVAAVLAP